LGNINVVRSLQKQQLATADGAVADKLAALFPPMLMWHSPFDMLRF
jgi:hypothetical protein